MTQSQWGCQGCPFSLQFPSPPAVHPSDSQPNLLIFCRIPFSSHRPGSSVLTLCQGELSPLGHCSFSGESQGSQSELGRAEILPRRRGWQLDTGEGLFSLQNFLSKVSALNCRWMESKPRRLLGHQAVTSLWAGLPSLSGSVKDPADTKKSNR